MKNTNRRIATYGNYFTTFYASLNGKEQEKIDYVFELIKNVNQIPTRFFKHLEGTEGLYEIRIGYESNIYRIICFFDDGNLIVLINSFQKKTQKTPNSELKLAKRLRTEYFIDKQNNTSEKRK